MLSSLDISPIMDTSRNNLTKEFFAPMLSTACTYDRGVGFFSSGWLKVNYQGMVNFANNGGHARWVTSPILDKSDWDALLTGYQAKNDPILHRILDQNISNLAETLEKDTLTALAWMVSDGIITFKLALPHNKLDNGDFHDKFGIFTDANGNKVSFNGSYNDSIQGLRNYESIKIFCSWNPAFTNLVKADQERFENLWNNKDLNLRVFDLPEAAREKILRLREDQRPYRTPEWVKVQQLRESKSVYFPSQPSTLHSPPLRDYQTEAITAWFDNDCQGLLEMATGTGKTITSLHASVQLFQKRKQLALIISVPYQHLVDQWNEEAKRFGYKSILAYKGKDSWLSDLNQQIMEYNAGYRKYISVITTHTTFAKPHFQKCIAKLKNNAMLIADEAHHLGAEQSRNSYPANIPFRLALTATPDRWFDDIGTKALRNYFGETVFSFPLEKAIGTYLTPYYYYPHLVPLTEDELYQYQDLSAKIAKLINAVDEKKQQTLELLLIQRAKLLNNAENKLTVLSDLIRDGDQIGHTLFYCSPEQIDDATQLLGLGKGLRVRRFTAKEGTKDRKQILEDFAKGQLQALVAMKCLDEGVDVPTTKTAYFLASSSNPREFIQRRGRILRKAPNKDVSIIHDLIAIPPLGNASIKNSPTFESEQKIMRKELQRFKEFANLANNKYKAIEVVWELAKSYDVMDF